MTTVLAAVGVWWVLGPLLAAQYLFAVISLIVLARRDVTMKGYAAWAAVILLVFFVGGIVFLVYNGLRPRPRKN